MTRRNENQSHFKERFFRGFQMARVTNNVGTPFIAKLL